MIYLDNNATTQPLPEVVDAMRESLLCHWGNPSSVHGVGQSARERVEWARERVAQLVGCSTRELIFCSSATESIALAMRGALEANPARRVIVTSALEHPAVRILAQQLHSTGRARILWVRHSPNGEMDLEHLRELLAQHADEIALVSLMAVNNETGVVLPVGKIAQMCAKHGVLLHTDATQTIGRQPFDVEECMVDFASFSAHKMHGPKGVGGLFARRGVPLSPQLVGGPQERERRAGTENVPGIVGFGVAAQAAREWLGKASFTSLTHVRDEFERLVTASMPEARIIGRDADRSWTTSSIAFDKLSAEAISLSLSNQGVCASAGAACSSGSLEPSPVLLAMGVPPTLAKGAIRFSFSRMNTIEEATTAASVVHKCVEQLRSRTSHAMKP